jgi:hypothetical protein
MTNANIVSTCIVNIDDYWHLALDITECQRVFVD